MLLQMRTAFLGKGNGLCATVTCVCVGLHLQIYTLVAMLKTDLIKHQRKRKTHISFQFQHQYYNATLLYNGRDHETVICPLALASVN